MIVKITKNRKEILKNGKKEPLSRADILLTLNNIRHLISEFELDKYYMILTQYDINHSNDNMDTIRVDDNSNIIYQMGCIIDKLKVIKDLFHDKLKQETAIKN